MTDYSEPLVFAFNGRDWENIRRHDCPTCGDSANDCRCGRMNGYRRGLR